MKTPEVLGSRLVRNTTALCVALLSASSARGQGTITFNGSAGLSSTYYEERGMWFQVVIAPGTSVYDDMAIGGPFPPGGPVPQNGTPYMLWIRQFNPYNYVTLSLTGGSLFGLTSVQLADPTAPSLSPVSISFVGYLFGGGWVTNTFTTPGDGATTFALHTFSPAFSFGFTHVDILAPRWAMDNLVFTVVPEPGALALLSLGALAFGARRFVTPRQL